MPKPKGNPKYTLDQLEEKLPPDLLNRLPDPSTIPFFTDKAKNPWVRAGTSKLSDNAPVWIRLHSNSHKTAYTFHNQTGHSFRIIHANKELSVDTTEYLPPFDNLTRLRSIYPGRSTDVESLKWFTELRALTMFLFVWCGHRETFVDFDKGEGLEVLEEVLGRLPVEEEGEVEKGDSDKDLGEEGKVAEGVDAGTEAGRSEEDSEEGENSKECEEREESGPATSAGEGSKKRDFDQFVEGQKD